MSILDSILGQAQPLRMPLFAVSLTALPHANTPVLLGLHWHAFRRDAGQRDAPLRAVPLSLLQLNPRWRALAELEHEVLDAAWQLGAWSLDRDEHRACNTVGAPGAEALACRRAFADPVLWAERDDDLPVESAPDREALMHRAGDVGYVQWQFRPVSGGIWPSADGDDTLRADGRREPPCPVTPLPPHGDGNRHTRYRLGHTARLILR
ncbi:hypothetical protein [Niveibacterium sp.]|uniref:hypothetical protein n=1 Tax=Niveibacterium sp. TaxID=2017444 RepID=UPI0035ADFFDD